MWFKKKEQEETCAGNYHDFDNLKINHDHLSLAHEAGFLEKIIPDYLSTFSIHKNYKKGNFIFEYKSFIGVCSAHLCLKLINPETNDLLTVLSRDFSSGITVICPDYKYGIDNFYHIKVFNKSLIDAALNFIRETIKVANDYKKEKETKEFLAQQEKEAKFASMLKGKL